MRLFLKLCLFVALFSITNWFCRKQTDGFALTKVTSSLSFHADWETAPPPSLEHEKILSQPFHYLGKGVQTFVFASEDGKYVLKLFRHDRMHAPFWMRLLPLTRLKARADTLDAHLFRDFNSYKIAYTELKEETGLVFLHLNKTPFFSKPVQIIDKLGISHFLDLNHMEFLIQKRADLLYVAIEKKIKSGKTEQAAFILKELVHLLAKRCQKGIFDKDPDLNTNFGVVEEKPIQIDVGRFSRNTTYQKHEVYKHEVDRITQNLQQWLEEKQPELTQLLREEIAQL